MNKLNSIGAHVNIIDLKNEAGHGTGTKVELIIPCSEKSLHFCSIMKTFTRNYWLIVILIVLFSIQTFAQPSDADKLRLQISKESNDTNKIKLLIRLGLLITLDQGESMKYLKEAYDLSLKKKLPHGIDLWPLL